ncbi:hypothetical protein TNCV_468471 [Trichonephila clavipes]|nr:hypothetical protein TNCV_468471 [Trichonephila clavipes]
MTQIRGEDTFKIYYSKNVGWHWLSYAIEGTSYTNKCICSCIFASVLIKKLHFSYQQSRRRMDADFAELDDINEPSGAANCNEKVAKQLYAQRYYRRHTSSDAFFACLRYRLSDCGSFILDIQEYRRRV